jgi:hypothetical protein
MFLEASLEALVDRPSRPSMERLVLEAVTFDEAHVTFDETQVPPPSAQQSLEFLNSLMEVSHHDAHVAMQRGASPGSLQEGHIPTSPTAFIQKTST